MSPSDPEFQKIIDLYAERVYSLALRIMGNPQDAEDATQEIFLRILEKLPRFRGNAGLATWIFRVTINTCLNHVKARSRRVTRIKVAEEIGKWVADPNTSPEDMFLQEETRELVARLIAKLTPIQASAVTLYYMEGMRYSEIGKVLRIPPGSVATALRRGRARMRELLKKTQKGDEK